MRDFFVVPRGRDAESKEAYKFLDWQLRRHRAEIDDAINRAVLDAVLYGESKLKFERANES